MLVCMHTCVCMCVFMCKSPVGHMLYILELEFQVVINSLIWALGTELGFSTRAANILTVELFNYSSHLFSPRKFFFVVFCFLLHGFRRV